MNLYIFIIGIVGFLTLALSMLTEIAMNKSKCDGIPDMLRTLNTVMIIISTAITTGSFTVMIMGDSKSTREHSSVLELALIGLGLVITVISIIMLTKLNETAKKCGLTLPIAVTTTFGLLLTILASFNYYKERRKGRQAFLGF